MMSPGPEPRVSAHPPHRRRSTTAEVLGSLQVELFPSAASTQVAFNKDRESGLLDPGHVQEA